MQKKKKEFQREEALFHSTVCLFFVWVMDIIKFDVLFQSKVTSYRLELVSHALTLFLSLSVSLIHFFYCVQQNL